MNLSDEKKQQILKWLKIACIVFLAVCVIYTIKSLHDQLESTQATVRQLSQDQLKNQTAVKDKLGVSTQDAGRIVKEIQYIQGSNQPPAVSYTIESPSLQSAADTTEKEIKAGISPANSIKADKTIVTPNTDKQKVDVYRVNLNKNHLIGIGGGSYDGDAHGTVLYRAGCVAGIYQRSIHGKQGADLLYVREF